MPAAADPGQTFAFELRLEGRPERWLFHLRSTALSLTIDTFTVYTFDREGRLFSTFQNGENCRRGLDGQILARAGRDEGAARVRSRRRLEAGEAAALVGALQERLGVLATAIRQGRARVEAARGAASPQAMLPWIERLRRWDAAALEADARRFAAVYRPVSILPPDQYMALVVQVTEGCPWNRCAFCDLYRDRPYRVRGTGELRSHLGEVRAFLGEALRLRRHLFLADGNLLSVPPARLQGLLEEVRAGFPEERFAELYAFCDVFGSRAFGDRELAALRELGLRRLYVGLETGADGLRRALNKPGSAAQLTDAVARLHRAGIRAGLIVLLGPGGREWADAHEAETAAALNRLDLATGDFVYFSPLVLPAGAGPERRAAVLGATPLSEAEMGAQRQRLEARLRCLAAGARTALYDIRDFTY
ncbi:MAG: radical SAM protein [Gemmatimonadota bacterium]